uniref:Uncharacterized protein n=1 Tax=Ixodes scapularis TaxID=6945 RepID=A0A4D5RFF1_IXOSC
MYKTLLVCSQAPAVSLLWARCIRRRFTPVCACAVHTPAKRGLVCKQRDGLQQKHALQQETLKVTSNHGTSGNSIWARISVPASRNSNYDASPMSITHVYEQFIVGIASFQESTSFSRKTKSKKKYIIT